MTTGSGPSEVLHTASSPLGDVHLEKDWLGSAHRIEVASQDFVIDFPDDVRSANFHRDYGSRNRESLLVYRYTADTCPVGYKLLSITNEKMYVADMGDCIRELEMNASSSSFIARAAADSRMKGYQWTYDRNAGDMYVAELTPAPTRSQSPRSTTPAPRPPSVASQPRSTSGSGVRTVSTRGTSSPAPTATPAPTTTVQRHQRLPTTGYQLPTEVDVVQDSGEAPTVVLN